MAEIKSKKKISQEVFVWVFAIPIFIGLAYVWSGELDTYRLVTKLVNAALVLVIGNLFFKFWLSIKDDVDDKIFSDAKATGQFTAGVYIALAIAITFG